ncbi:hypothetical protein PAXRUDRAFT_827200 [Paxillus rubicundulus Ve08.2h10]|uniref:Uncharacterized protein n=1 Tax=Paxillus rubicundulus Ve08.2h10 TaxID=930991 RepID=A0A0D0E339_9AGAM|nr:hypothetical protein PAXRUDRAFT_827200 [Paxillus rubicundulus Ve08.2h10]
MSNELEVPSSAVGGMGGYLCDPRADQQPESGWIRDVADERLMQTATKCYRPHKSLVPSHVLCAGEMLFTLRFNVAFLDTPSSALLLAVSCIGTSSCIIIFNTCPYLPQNAAVTVG